MARERNQSREQIVASEVLAQHRGLEARFAETRAALQSENPGQAASEAFARLRDALGTHFEQEDELYYPAIWVLRPSEKPELLGFVEAHRDFRTRLREIEAHLDRQALDEASRAFAHLAESFAAHEVAEERLLRDLDRQLAPRANGG